MEPEGTLPHSQVPPPVLILSQIYPVHSPLSHLRKTHFNIVVPSKPESSKWSHFLRFPNFCPLPHTYHMPCPSHSSRFDQPKNIWCSVQIMNLLIMYFFSLPCYLVTLRPKYSPQQPILKHPQPTFLHQCKRPSFTSIHNSRQKFCSVYFNLKMFG
jgi:hypothetical protein